MAACEHLQLTCRPVAHDKHNSVTQSSHGCTAGYFAAPGARLYPLSHRKSRRPKPLPPVTLVFCAIDGYHDVMAENHVHGELATTQCYNACRQLLRDRNGYECGAEEGTFLAAFVSGTEALQFCVVVSAAYNSKHALQAEPSEVPNLISLT